MTSEPTPPVESDQSGEIPPNAPPPDDPSQKFQGDPNAPHVLPGEQQ